MGCGMGGGYILREIRIKFGENFFYKFGFQVKKSQSPIDT